MRIPVVSGANNFGYTWSLASHIVETRKVIEIFKPEMVNIIPPISLPAALTPGSLNSSSESEAHHASGC